MTFNQTSAEITTEPATIQTKNAATQTETQTVTQLDSTTIDPTVLSHITNAGLLAYVDDGVRRGVRTRYNRAERDIFLG